MDDRLGNYRLMNLTDFHAKYFAHELTKRSASDNVEMLAGVLSDAQVDLNPHQIEAALFAFRNPFSRGAILADEVARNKEPYPPLREQKSGFDSFPKPQNTARLRFGKTDLGFRMITEGRLEFVSKLLTPLLPQICGQDHEELALALRPRRIAERKPNPFHDEIMHRSLKAASRSAS